ncbi:MAG: 16S rRNA (guanine(527)-N(7))-methyltransferase RsmG [Acidobacteriota bacterium]|nr:16S rRNA (guanine(527)-N(7))-methyltransferase RsmG [Acidobacteriota bacterium]
MKSASREFRESLESEAAAYRVALTNEALEKLSDYYELLNAWNSRLHLVAPTSPQEFATRHIMESLLLLQHLPQRARVADIGSGAGLPIIPCLIARPDVHAVLVEASKKKAVFLREALNKTSTANRATVIAERFENTATPDVGFVTCRALERFETMLPRLIEWAPAKATLLLFGGDGLGRRLEDCGFAATSILIPKSNRRFLFVLTKV